MTVRILVVDDASFIRDMVKKHLREKIPGVEICEAVDGNRAMAVIKNQAVDLILSDWEMPNMSGEELLRAVRASAQGADTPFVMVSSRGDRNHVVKAVAAGVSDYLTKPFTPDELLRKVFKQLKAVGKLPNPNLGRPAATQGIAFASVEALTGGRPAETLTANRASANALENPTSSASLLTPTPKSPAARTLTSKGRAQLRFAGSSKPVPCVIRELSLQSLGGLMQRSDSLPRLFDQAVVDIEMGEGGELARVNGYIHSLQAGENRPETNVVKIEIRFVDNDAEKFEVLSRYIAQM